jgi:hypothetical protein
MAIHFSAVTTKDWWKFFGAFLLVLALGVAGRFLYSPCWRWSDAFFALFDAMIVAGLIGICFEVFSTKFLITRVAEDLTEKLVGRGLPPQLQHHIKQITETDIVREEYVKVYKLGSPVDGRVTLEIKLTFNVKNYSDRPVRYAPLLQDEAVYEPKVTYLEYRVGDHHKFYQTEEELNTIRNIDLNTKVVTWQAEEAKIRPSKDGDVGKVRWHYQIRMPDEYSDVTSFALATIGVSLVLDSIPPELEFFSSGKHLKGAKTWEYEEPFIANQHIRVWWFKKAKPAAQLPVAPTDAPAAPSGPPTPA